MSLHKDEAIVLSKRAYGESDRIIHLFTREAGKVSAIAKGAGKSRKRFVNTLEPFNHIRVEYFEKQGRGMVRIENADLVTANNGIEMSMRRACSASFFAEFVDRLTREREHNGTLFTALKEFIELARTKDPVYADILHYELLMLDALGYHPNFDTCVYCGAAMEETERLHFSRERGGILCAVCAQSLPHRRCTQGLISGFLSAKAMRGGFATGALEREAQEIMESFLAYHIDTDFRSYRLLKTLVF
ncbi:MAG: DNA repair protein RecO [Syntrophorhabdus sp. PtaB.Bin184]|jgi:DNA repair protein RecO (recombination protein O)|nr:MAG: DNA repair protein RecO [Syntrophorhabdus sp. PtaB.Bin184]